jgi:hypothetical protein
VDEKALIPDAIRATAPNIPTIADLAGIEEVRTVSLSRFHSVRLVRLAIKRNFDYCAAKYYNACDNRDGLRAFHDRVRGLVSLSHPSVMPIVGLIAPTKTVGPIVLTPCSEIGAIADVLDQVMIRHRFGTKLENFVSQGVVHPNLRLSDERF